MLRREAWVFVIASYIVVGFAYLWPAGFRNESLAYVAVAWAAFMLRTFMYHFGLVLVLVAIVAGWTRNVRLLLATLPLALFTVGPTWWQYLPQTSPEISGRAVTVMSVNLLMVNERTGPLVEEIRSVDADILLLQEYTDHWHEALQRGVGGAYPHIVYVPRDDSFGAAIYSKWPFVGQVNRYIPLGSGTEPQMRAVVQTPERRIAVYNVHLLPPWGMEYVIETRTQFADLIDVLGDERLPLVLGGDFNFTENSLQATSLRRAGLTDAYGQGGWGRGPTWPVHGFFRWAPGVRLDHIYLGRGLACVEFRSLACDRESWLSRRRGLRFTAASGGLR